MVFMKTKTFVLTETDLRQRQSLPLESKVKWTERVIRSFVDNYGLDGVYISFSGGKDSTVLLHIARRIYPEIKAVYLDTWMEYPQIRSFVKEFENVTVIKPEISLKEIVSQYGWCFPSKDVSEAICAARKGQTWAINKLHGLDKDGNVSEYRRQYRKFLPVLDWDVKISPACCDKQKEEPITRYEKTTGRHPIVATMASESARRKEAYLRTGCNSFDVRIVHDADGGDHEIVVNRPISKPMSIWMEQDVLTYIAINNVRIAPPYGELYREGECAGQINLFELLSGQKNCNCMPCAKYCLSGEKRTGCMFCPVGCQLDNFAKFKRLRKLHPKLYDYCMEELGEKKLLEFVQKQFGGNIYN